MIKFWVQNYGKFFEHFFGIFPIPVSDIFKGLMRALILIISQLLMENYFLAQLMKKRKRAFYNE